MVEEKNSSNFLTQFLALCAQAIIHVFGNEEEREGSDAKDDPKALNRAISTAPLLYGNTIVILYRVGIGHESISI